MAENMIHEYQLENLSCGDCALKIEDAVKRMPEVRFASVNFAAGKLRLDTDDLPAVVSLIQQIEPQVDVLPAGAQKKEDSDGQRRELGLIGLSALLFLIGIAISPLISAPWFPWAIFGSAYLISGHRVLIRAVNNLRVGQWFDETFLMSISTLGAFAIQELPEAVGVMLFYQIGEYIQGRSVARSRQMIQALMEISPDTAIVLGKDGSQTPVSPEDVQVGAVILVRPGDRVPLDGEVLNGESMVDSSMLTGEPVPVPVGPGDEVFGGTVNQAGELKVQVTRPAGDSAASRMLALVEDAVGRKAKTEQFITRFAKVYTPVMVGLALVVAFLPPLLISGQTFQDWIYRALILLVISCPCALVISIPLGYFGGIGAASRRGILVKGANFLDVLAQVRTVVFDKTGTLTKGAFRVVEIMPVEGLSENELLALAARAEGNSTHPLASAVRAAYRKHASADQDFSEDSVEELAGFGRRVDVGGQVILIGNDAILHRENVPHPACDVDGTVMFIAVDGEYQGYLRVDDELKAEASQAINSLRESGVRHISMLSGDHAATAGRVAKAVGLDDFQAELLPSEKVSQLEEIIARSSDGTVAFVGDGINDAAGLARADVGIAMGALGTDAAREAADVVLVTDEISRIAEAISLARRTRRIVWQNIGLALGIKLVFILLGVAGSASMWEAVFADVGVTILAVLNSIRVLRN